MVMYFELESFVFLFSYTYLGKKMFVSLVIGNLNHPSDQATSLKSCAKYCSIACWLCYVLALAFLLPINMKFDASFVGTGC